MDERKDHNPKALLDQEDTARLALSFRVVLRGPNTGEDTVTSALRTCLCS